MSADLYVHIWCVFRAGSPHSTSTDLQHSYVLTTYTHKIDGPTQPVVSLIVLYSCVHLARDIWTFELWWLNRSATTLLCMGKLHSFHQCLPLVEYVHCVCTYMYLVCQSVYLGCQWLVDCRRCAATQRRRRRAWRKWNVLHSLSLSRSVFLSPSLSTLYSLSPFLPPKRTHTLYANINVHMYIIIVTVFFINMTVWIIKSEKFGKLECNSEQ